MQYGEIRNLKYLYLWNASNEEIAKLCSNENGIANYEIPTLQYFAISYGDKRFICSANINTDSQRNGKVTDISPLANLNDVTKKAIKYMSLENNKIESIESLKEFTNIYLLKIKSNNLKSLSGIENMSNLTYLLAHDNLLGQDEDSSQMNPEKDSLSAIATVDMSSGNIAEYTYSCNLPKLSVVSLQSNSNLIWCNYLKKCRNIEYLYLSGCDNLNGIAVENIKNIINNCKSSTEISSKYTLSLLDDNTTVIDLTSLKVEESVFRSLAKYKNVTELNLKNMKILKDGVEQTEINSIVNEVLSNFSKMKFLGLYGLSSVNEMSFVKNMPDLQILDLRGTNISTTNEATGLQLLNEGAPNLISLVISNSTIDLTKIQKCIDKLNVRRRCSKFNCREGILWTCLLQ